MDIAINFVLRVADKMPRRHGDTNYDINDIDKNRFEISKFNLAI